MGVVQFTSGISITTNAGASSNFETHLSEMDITTDNACIDLSIAV